MSRPKIIDIGEARRERGVLDPSGRTCRTCGARALRGDSQCYTCKAQRVAAEGSRQFIEDARENLTRKGR